MVRDADFLYTDVWTSMGQEAEAKARSTDFVPYQINASMMKFAPSHCKVLHCLPARRGLEITNCRMLLTPEEQAANPAFASVLKLKGVELQQDLANLLMRIAGPQGIERRPLDGETDDASDDPGAWQALPAPRYFYSRAASIYGGTSEVQKDILAKTTLG